MVDKVEEARKFLELIGMPKAQQSDICCYVLLAMADIKSDMSWNEAKNNWIRIHDIIQFSNAFYGTIYAENSRETFRKQALHRFRTAALVEDNKMATNSPNYRYRLTEETLKILKTFQSLEWQKSLKRFLTYHEKLIDIYAFRKKMTMMPVKINGADFKFSAGKHNELQRAIIEEFAPRFASNSECLYVGDTVKKDLVKNVDKLTKLGFEITCNDKSPSEIQSWNIPTVKSVLSRKINEATHVVVIVGKEANKLHKDRVFIGYRNWQNFEVAKAKELRKHIIAVQLNSLYEYPEELKSCGATRVYSFNHDDIVKAVRG